MRTQRSKNVFVAKSTFFIGIVILFLTGCGSSNSTSRGTLTSISQLTTLSTEQVAGIYAETGFPLPAPKYGIILYKIDYETLDPAGLSTIASGLLAVPDAPSGVYPVISYDHGTEVQRSEVPSNPDDDEGVAIWAAFAAAGYVVVAPDYVGLGDNKEAHPFLHAQTEASATVDLMRAGQFESNTLGYSWGNVYITGYSQGGHAAMATLEDLQTNESGEFNLALAAPGAGPYDLSGITVPAALQASGDFATFTAAYLPIAYNPIYQLFTSFNQVFVSPFDQTVPPLFDGYHTEDQIFAALPASPLELLQKSFVASLGDPNSPLVAALQANDVYNFLPSVPVRLFHSTQDDVVPFQNSEAALQAMTALGGNVQIIPLTGTHEEAFGPYVVGIRELIDAAELEAASAQQ